MFESNTPKKALMFCIAHIISCPLKSTLFFCKGGKKDQQDKWRNRTYQDI